MLNDKQKPSAVRSSDLHQAGQRPICADHHVDLQNSISNQSKRSRLDQSNEVLPSPRLSRGNSNGVLPSPRLQRAKSSVPRQEAPPLTIDLPSNSISQRTRNLPPSNLLHPKLQRGNEQRISFESINAPLASAEDVNIDKSIRNLCKGPSPSPISRLRIDSDPSRLSKTSRSHSYQRIPIDDRRIENSSAHSTSQLHYSRNAPVPKARLSISTDRKNLDDEVKAGLRDIPRLSTTQIKTRSFQSLQKDLDTTSCKRIRAHSVHEQSRLTGHPIPSSDNLQPVESSSPKVLAKKAKISCDTSVPKTVAQPGRCGLQNIGNTCFMNSALQCLSNVPQLTKYILENDIRKIVNTTNDLGTHGKMALAYADLIKEMWSGQRTTANGSSVKRYVGELSPRFMGYNQQDSHEFLNVLLDALHEDLKEDSDDIDDETSLIAKIFHGQMRSTVTCVCEETVITSDSISFLALPIPDLPAIRPPGKYPSDSVRRPVTLVDCFKELFKTEQIGDNGHWYCNRCDCLTNAEKKLQLWTPPTVLILQLKRFTYDVRNNNKIQTLVEFPFDSPLDLRPFITNPDYKESTLYNLIAISCHTGSLAGGHYTTYAKNFCTNSWFHFDDQIVSEADKQSLLSPHAYILVYRRQNHDNHR